MKNKTELAKIAKYPSIFPRKTPILPQDDPF